MCFAQPFTGELLHPTVIAQQAVDLAFDVSGLGVDGGADMAIPPRGNDGFGRACLGRLQISLAV